jgi:hypothetical protein
MFDIVFVGFFSRFHKTYFVWIGSSITDIRYKIYNEILETEQAYCKYLDQMSKVLLLLLLLESNTEHQTLFKCEVVLSLWCVCVCVLFIVSYCIAIIAYYAPLIWCEKCLVLFRATFEWEIDWEGSSGSSLSRSGWDPKYQQSHPLWVRETNGSLVDTFSKRTTTRRHFLKIGNSFFFVFNNERVLFKSHT